MIEPTSTQMSYLGACVLCGNRTAVDTSALPTTGKTFCLHCWKCYPRYIQRIIDAAQHSVVFIGDGG